jgi:hypothetical protein
MVFPLFFLAVVNCAMTRAQEVRILVLAGLMMALQVPLAAAQKITGYYESYDRIGGSFGRAGTPTMSVVMGLAWSGIVALVIATGKLRYAALLPLTFVPLVLGAANAGFVFAAVGSFAALLVCLAMTETARFRLLLIVGIAAPIVVVYAAYAFAPELISATRGVGDFGLRFFRAPATQLTAYLTGYQATGAPNRFEQLRFAIDQAALAPELLFGHGFGVLSSSVLLERGGYSSVWSILGSATSAAKYLVETGLLGLGTYAVFVASLWPRRLLPEANRGSSYARFLVVCMAAFVAVYLLAGLYTAAWQSGPVAVPFFLVAALGARAIARQSGGLQGRDGSAGPGTTVHSRPRPDERTPPR